MPTPEITTARLILNRLTGRDAEALFAYRSLPEVRRFQHWEPRELVDARQFIERLESTDFGIPGTWSQFAIREQASMRLAGDLGVYTFDEGRQAEIGFSLDPAFHGVGFATEAVTGLLDYLFSQAKLHRISASVDPRNESSVRLLRRVGMRQEAHFRRSLWFKGDWADDLVFAVLRSEWRDGG